MPEKIVIPFSLAEYVGQFRRPALQMLGGDRVAIIQDIVDAWEPWNFQLGNMEIKSQGTPAEQGISFKLPDQGITFFLGALGYTFQKENATWPGAGDTLKVLEAARGVVCCVPKVELATQTLTIVLHFQPKTKQNKSILAPLIAENLGQLFPSEPTVYSTSLRWKDRHITLDGSASYANGIFLKLSHSFDGQASLETIAKALLEDELALFRLLDVEEVGNNG
jgi:hypothetical protein